MKLRVLALPLVAVAVILGMSVHAVSAKQPDGRTKLVGGLHSPRGMKIGPDGMLYVAEAGFAGDIKPPTEDGGKSGFTGRISAIDLTTGERTTVIENLPSNGSDEGDSVGPADVAFIGNQLYYLQTHGGAFYGFPDNPTGLYRVNRSEHSAASIELVADIGAFNIENPIADVKDKLQMDVEVGGNPYAMVVRDGAFLVTDGNQNQVMQITTGGSISRVAEFHGHPVETGIASADGGPLYVTTLGQYPFAAADGAVYKIGYPTGNISKIASGHSSMTDVEFGPGGQLYALNFGDQAGEGSQVPWIPGSASLFRLDAATGDLTPIATGFTFATAVIFDGDTAYVTSGGVTIPGVFDGEIWKIEGVSGLAPLAQPTAAPEPTKAPVATPTRTGVTPPDTGTGSANGSGSPLGWLLVAGFAVAGAALMGGSFALKRR